MAATATTRLDVSPRSSPTGLTAGEVRSLRRGEKVLIAGWHESVAGDDNGRPWLPGAVRALPLAARLALAGDDELMAAWIERERRRVLDVAYFTGAYGHVRNDEEPGPPIPFDLWPAQRRVLDVFRLELLIAVLKARQLGLTWLALHDGYHFAAIDPAGRNAVILGLSQDGGYAKRLLERARAINDLLPPFLRQREDRDTQGSKTEFKMVDRGRLVSLPGTPDAPRSWQADLAICDEWAFVRNGNAGPTMRALMPAARRIIAISSGNGGPDEEGNGQHFATLYTRAREGENEWTPVFLPTSTHPSRTPAWRETERRNYDTDEEFLAEHPETDDEALIGAGRDRFFKLGQVAAAVAAGRELDALLGTPKMPPPAGGQIHGGTDWGERSFGLVIWPLEGGGVYVPPCEVVHVEEEPGETTVAWHRAVAELQNVDPETGRLEPPIGEARFDAAGIQSQRTFLSTARARFAHQYAGAEVRSRSVPFGKYKRETAGYLKRLFKRVGEGRTTGIIAISPANVELIRQLRALESDPRDTWKKENDHGPDALVAAVQRIARTHRELRGDEG
jgi:hypothetical protein